MKKNIFANTIQSLSLSREYTTFLFFALIFGISTGVFFEVLMSTDMKADMQYYLQNLLLTPLEGEAPAASSFAALVGSVILNLLALALIALSGYTRFTYPVSCAMVIIKGLSLGYCCALILETLDLKGALVIALSLFPQNTLLLPAFFLSANLAVAKAASSRHKKNKGMVRSFNASDAPYLYAHVFLGLLVVASCLLQSLFLPLASRLV